MRRLHAALWLAVLGSAFVLTGCGPGLIAAGGGTVGAIFGLQPKDEDDKKDPPAPSTNVAPAVVITSLTREQSPASINYSILDANNDPCSVEIEYAVGAGAYQPCAAGSGGDGVTALTSSAAGTAHVFEWDYLTDLGPEATTDITLRVRANDGVTAGSWGTLASQSTGDDAPVLSNVSFIGTGGVILITFTLTDANSDLGSLAVEWSTDQGAKFTPVDAGTEILGNPPSNLATSPGGSAGQFIWNSSVALSNYVGEVLLRFEVQDQPAGFSLPVKGAPTVEGPYNLDNAVNQAPELTLTSAYDGASFTGQVPIPFTLSDHESDAAVVIVKYTTVLTNPQQGDFANCTLVNQFSSGIAGPFLTTASPTAYSATWDCLADLKSNPAINTTGVQVRFVIAPADSQPGTATLTDAFTVLGNTKPQVNACSPLQDSGNIPLVINIQDDNEDPVSVTVEYSFDQTTWNTIPASDWVFGDPAQLVSSKFGADNVLIWNSLSTLGTSNHATVFIRLVPTDHPPSATPLRDLTGDPYVSASFPVINDPNGADPVSIAIFTTDSPQTLPVVSPPSTPQYETVKVGQTRFLDRNISPGGATVTDTFWFIDEDWADFGTLQDIGGAPLLYSTATLATNAPGAGTDDGDTVTIDDLANGPTTFEFDNNGLLPVGHVAVYIVGAVTDEDVAQALVDAVNNTPNFYLTASRAAATITLTHRIAAKVTRAASLGNGGAATDITETGGAVGVLAQLNGGTGVQNVKYVPPVAYPSPSNHVSIKCFIDHPSFFLTVQATYELYWGEAPASVTVSPNPVNVLLSGFQDFTAVVGPAGAPQNVTWEVDGGAANGVVDSNGRYYAPGIMPPSSLIYVRARSIDNTVSGVAAVTLVPRPTGVTVIPPAASPPQWSPNDLQLGASITFTAIVLPTAAPQTVYWRVRFGGTDRGSGDSMVGTITSGGVYTAPATLPSPDYVEIEAVSTAETSVYGSYTVRLKAPPPTSFDVVPSTASVYANGVGQQFSAINFVPSNANQAVTWETDPPSGMGTVSSSGFYTPPSWVGGITQVTVRARSAVASTVLDEAIVTISPAPGSIPPGNVTVTPGEGITTSTGPELQFTAVVDDGSGNTAGVSQGVTWAVTSVVPAGSGGSIDATGKFTPPGSGNAVDRVVTVRCTATASPNPFEDFEVRVTGQGYGIVDYADLPLGRKEATPVYENVDDRVWIIGGISEDSGSDHTLAPLYMDQDGGVGGTPIWGVGPTIPTALLSKPPNFVTAVFDSQNSRLLAMVGQGTVNEVVVLELALPATGSWSKLTTSGGDVPKIGGNTRPVCFYDDGAEQMFVVTQPNEMYVFDTSGTNAWQSKEALSGSSTKAPQQLDLDGFAYNPTSNKLYMVGASDAGGSATTRIHILDRTAKSWSLRTSTGDVPGVALNNPGLYYDGSNTIWLFGGRESGAPAPHSNVYSIDISATPAPWTLHAPAAGTQRPFGRNDAMIVEASGYDIYLMAGYTTRGPIWDVWSFNTSAAPPSFTAHNAADIRPQGRVGAAMARKGNEFYVWGGLADHGLSNELWVVYYAIPSFKPVWQRLDTTGDVPPAMQDASMIYQTNDGVMILFGGTNNINTKPSGASADVYVLDVGTNVWTKYAPSGSWPSARFGASMCYFEDSGAGTYKAWMFGGEGPGGKLNDLWELDFSSSMQGTWSAITATTPPDAREGATLGFDDRRDRLLLLGGSSFSGANRQYYEFSFTTGVTGSWAARSTDNGGTDENVYRSGGLYEDEFRRFLNAPTGKTKLQGLVVASNGSPTWQYLTSPTSNNYGGCSSGFYPDDGRYWVVFGERTVGAKTFGTNAVRIIRVK
ncbi:MAG: hypothetical protein IT463_10085 [Planctomycetes bacterium]|nr:hypothetical protein [Planctomycetota bacterium]